MRNGAPRKWDRPLKGQKNTGKFSWKDVAPKQGDPKTKSNNGKKYYWCWKHKQWTVNKPDNCRLSKYPEANQAKAKHVEQGKSDAESDNDKKDIIAA